MAEKGELFGPSAWLEGFYLAALKAAAEMADALGYPSDAQIYRELFAKGSAWTEENLFNGKYYIHKVDVTDRSILERFGVSDKYWNDEAGQILYQIANGCEIDQICAQWHAVLCGLGDIFDPEHRRIALKSLFQNNYKPSMRNLYNTWRLFAMNDEGGTIMCDYPEGVEKPIIPITYCEECMSGFEYALAELMISEGMLEEGMTMIRSIRDRNDGKKRNPFNEIECGNNYARGMASFGLLPIFSGFTYDMTKHRMGFAPIMTGNEFSCLWACGGAWGQVKLDSHRCTLTVLEGTLTLQTLALAQAKDAHAVTCDGNAIPFEKTDSAVCWHAPVAITSELQIEF